MHFILAPGCIDQFDGLTLRNAYENKRKVNLEATPSMIGLPTMFGGTDVRRRREQVSFLEKIKTVINDLLRKEEDIKSIEDWQKHLTACRIMIAACLYVQHKITGIKGNSALYCLINEYLGITAENYMDDRDRYVCYHTAFRLTNQVDALTYLNELLRMAKQKEFSEDEWEEFSLFLGEQEKDAQARKALKMNPSKYPITNAVQPVFKSAFSYVGSTIGWVVAEAISSSSASIGPRLALTSYVSSALLVIGSGGTAGVALLAPTIASKLVGNFCTISLASITGTAFGYVGKGAGAAVGIPFDLAYSLLKSAGSLIVNYSEQAPSLAAIDGIRIADGVIVTQGIPMQFHVVPQNKLTDAHKPLLQITDEGAFMEGKAVKDANMDKVIEELRVTLAAKSEAPLVEEPEDEEMEDLRAN